MNFQREKALKRGKEEKSFKTSQNNNQSKRIQSLVFKEIISK